MCPPPVPQHLGGGGAQKHGRHISERGMCAHMGLRLFYAFGSHFMVAMVDGKIVLALQQFGETDYYYYYGGTR